jgi:hypothetical protein
MLIDGEHFAWALEDPFRNLNGDITKKVKGDTCIDNGTYEVVVTMSNRFKKELPLLLNVPCFEGVRIHAGNTSADSQGCILIGAETDHIGKIWNCSLKVAELIERIKAAGKCTIEISTE